MNKLIGYVLAVVGVIGLAAANIPQVGTAISLPQGIDSNILMIISGVVALIGIIMVVKGGGGFGKGKQAAEVPIYHGKNVVGFRRMGK